MPNPTVAESKRQKTVHNSYMGVRVSRNQIFIISFVISVRIVSILTNEFNPVHITM
jgi:hypothetical protein